MVFSRGRKRSRTTRAASQIKLPHATDWRTSDEDEVNRRVLRAAEETPRVENLTPQYRVFSNFRVCSRSGLEYEVEIAA